MCFFIVLKLVENQLGLSPVVFLFIKNAAEKFNDISGRKTMGLPSRIQDSLKMYWKHLHYCFLIKTYIYYLQ